MLKIITILGARPQFIKAAILSKTFLESGKINEIIIHTGQHFDFNMDKIFFDELNIPQPKYNLNINSLPHGAMTGLMLLEIEKILIEEKPDYVLVYGDTNSTLAGALAAKKLHIKLIHVEAGLRSFNINMPEEINRILTDRISDLLFCPTEQALKNLANEGFNNFNSTIVNSGDVMLDLALYFKKLQKDKGYFLSEPKNDFILCTIHREENTLNINNLVSIINSLNRISKEIEIVLPLHPRTRNIIRENNLKLDFDTPEPLGYFEMMKHIEKCKLVITDSGGLQKEAFFFRKMCITLRQETEWTELTEYGFNRLVGSDEEQIYNAYKTIGTTSVEFDKSFYGTGNSCNIILNTIISNHPENFS